MFTAAILTLAATAGPVDLTPSPLYLARRGQPTVILTPRLISAPIVAVCAGGSCQRMTYGARLPRLIPGQPIARFWQRRPIQRFWSRRPIARFWQRRPIRSFWRNVFRRRR